jgi:mitotic spindle assembly checkpoint protein MAD2
MASVGSSNTITLRGSTEIVAEFFEYSVNNILYQRGIYPPESFKRIPKYGLSMVLSTEEGLCTYMENIVKQLNVWLLNHTVQKLILVVKGVDSGETLERWAFNVEVTERENLTSNVQSNKSIKEITQEIQAIMRQITASVTFLPLLAESCSFDLLVYADKEATVPVTWEDSDPCIIKQAEEVKLRSFSTKIHQVDLSVQYRVDPEGI